ncbi:MarR family transcriptional regulator [Amycolatopsis balhimycina DSM 5908]|uniref:MarR family transcriptional regulator n=1 Tax=Amycolatopsis balhimycina DSM 5908 TaxID=1081091 RepID=A0A428WU94_AMYBA|nr:MarR family transcriptional regulator [Amycolatopsis balhimycina]RSM46664.1 MarR family transcriptional regulator [Amycolatopsis balhimycina DSM 5908]
MDDDLATARAVRSGVLRLARRLRGARSAHALSPAKVGVLGYLFRHGTGSPGEIAAADGQRPQALTKVFAELEAEELITRAPNENDGRGAVLALTGRGRTALLADMRERDEWLATALDELTETEAGLLRLAAPLLERLADQTAPRPSEREHAEEDA